MITGELEYLYGKGDNDYEYDYFFKKLFKKRTKDQKEKARAKRKKFFSKGGKAEEIIEGVGSIINFMEPQNEGESDFEIGLGNQALVKPSKKKVNPKIVYMGLAITATIGGLWIYSKIKNKKAIQVKS